ncbi:MAG: ABC transporter permease [Chloroflexota bacterium]
MTAIARIFLYEFRRQSRRRAYRFMSVGVPLIVLLIFFGFRIYQQIRPADTGLSVDLSKTKDNASFRPVGFVDQSGLMEPPSLFSGLIRFDSEDEAQAAVRSNQIGGYYVIAQDYLRTGEVNQFFDRFSFSNLSNTGLKSLIIDSLSAGKNIDPNLIERLQSSIVVSSHAINEAGTAKQTTSGDTSYFLAYVFSLTLIFSSFITSGYLMQSIVEEKESRMIEILLSSIRPVELLAGKILALGLLGLIQMLLWGVTLLFIVQQLPTLIPQMLGVKPPSGIQLVVLLIYFVLGYLLLAAVYTSIGALATNMREGPQLAAFITLPFALPMYALSIITASPGGPLAVGLSLFPITAPLTMVSRIAISDVPPLELAISISLLMLTIALAIWVAGRLFRVNTLLSGQLPRLRDLPRLIRKSI